MAQFTFVSASRSGGHIDVVPDDNRFPLFTVDRHTGWFSTKSDLFIRKHINGAIYEVGEASVKYGEVICDGRVLSLHRSGVLTSSEMFIASNGMRLKWHVHGTRSVALLQVEDGSNRCLASYTAAHGLFHRHPARLTVYSEGTMMLDEVIATAVYIARKMVIKKRSQATADA